MWVRHLAIRVGMGLDIWDLASVWAWAFGIWHRCGFRHLVFDIGVCLGIWHLASVWV